MTSNNNNNYDRHNQQQNQQQYHAVVTARDDYFDVEDLWELPFGSARSTSAPASTSTAARGNSGGLSLPLSTTALSLTDMDLQLPFGFGGPSSRGNATAATTAGSASSMSMSLSSSSLDNALGWPECSEHISFDLLEFERSAHRWGPHGLSMTSAAPISSSSSASMPFLSAREFLHASLASPPIPAQQMPSLNIVGDEVVMGMDGSSTSGGSSTADSSSGGESDAEQARLAQTQTQPQRRQAANKRKAGVIDLDSSAAGGSGSATKKATRAQQQQRKGQKQTQRGPGSPSAANVPLSTLSFPATTFSESSTNVTGSAEGVGGRSEADVMNYITSILDPLNEANFDQLDAAVSRVCANDCILRMQRLRGMGPSSAPAVPEVERVVPRQEISAFFKSVMDSYPDCSWQVETTKIRKGAANGSGKSSNSVKCGAHQVRSVAVVSSFSFRGTYLPSVYNKFDEIFTPAAPSPAAAAAAAATASDASAAALGSSNARSVSVIGTFSLTLNREKDKRVSIFDVIYLAEAAPAVTDV